MGASRTSPDSAKPSRKQISAAHAIGLSSMERTSSFILPFQDEVESSRHGLYARTERGADNLAFTLAFLVRHFTSCPAPYPSSLVKFSGCSANSDSRSFSKATSSLFPTRCSIVQAKVAGSHLHSPAAGAFASTAAVALFSTPAS